MQNFNWLIGFGIFFIIISPLAAYFGGQLVAKGKEYQWQSTIKSRLDHKSLELLQNLNGLMFFKESADEQTIRYLIQQGIIKNEVFPSKKITFGYCLTKFGTDVLSKLGIKTFPNIIIDMHRVRYWLGYKNEFEDQKRTFEKSYRKDFDQCIKSFVTYIPGYSSKDLKSFEDQLDIFSKYLENTAIFYDGKMKIINKWLSDWFNK